MFAATGLRIILLLREIVTVNDRAKIAFRRVTGLLVSSVFGFFALMVCIGVNDISFPTITQVCPPPSCVVPDPVVLTFFVLRCRKW